MKKRFETVLILLGLAAVLLQSCKVKNAPMEPAYPTPTPTCEVCASKATVNDMCLRGAILKALGKQQWCDICISDLEGLEQLNLGYKGISDLTGLEKCVNLRQLNLNNNLIQDVAPVMGLQKLEQLNLRGNKLTSLDGFSGRTLNALHDLDISQNNLTSLKPLGGINAPDLKRVWASGNKLTSLNGIGNMPLLEQLDVSSNTISDFGDISQQTGLMHLNIAQNCIANLGPLAGLDKLIVLDATGNSLLTDISGLVPLTQLLELYLSYCSINDISSLSGLVNLKILSLADNGIYSTDPLVANVNAGGFQVDFASYDINLLYNPLDSDSMNVDIPYMQSKGLVVLY